MFPPPVETQGDTPAQCFSTHGFLHSSKILKALCQAGLSLGEPLAGPCGTVFPVLPWQRSHAVGERFGQDLLSTGRERPLQWGMRWGELRTAWSDLHRIKSLRHKHGF